MGTDAFVWPCPICGQALDAKPYKSGKGFTFTCHGSASLPHDIKIYLQEYEPDADFLPVATVPVTKDSQGRKTRARDLLARVQSIGEGGSNGGSEASS